jgi:tetratricopeptide (TPR) repeat protein/predicted Ser/Thr protein kinase
VGNASDSELDTVALDGRRTAAGKDSMRRVHDVALQRLFGGEPALPGALGRYQVISEAGHGALGVVMRAYDPRLRREVALKRVRTRHGEDRDAEAEARLLREARALASLAHPNVAAVYDVEEMDGAVLMAMEFVEGETLEAWIAARLRTWREVLRVMTPAVRGLAAAHDVGLVHRDFKPGNVIVGADGRVRVVDFGLARAADSPADSSSPRHLGAPPSADDVGPDASTLTAMGTIVGTPAYMAPEQHRGGSADARSDQYAFCVTLWEALWGKRPFAGDLDELGRAKHAGVTSTPPGRRTPAWLRRVVLRGLSPEPDKRFASMHELLVQVVRAGTRAWIARAAAVAAVLLLGVVAVQGWSSAQRARIVESCEAEGAAITQVWNDEARAAVRGALGAMGIGGASNVADRTLPWLDAYADEWSRARAQACIATSVERIQSAETLDRSRWCLDERRMELAALVDELSHTETVVMQRAVQAAAGLPRIGPCREGDALARLPPPPPEPRSERLERVRRELATVRARAWSGRYAEALEMAQAVISRAEQIDWPPLHASAQLHLGMTFLQRGRYEDAENILTEAYFGAVAVDATEVSFEAARLLTVVVGEWRGRRGEGFHWGRLAEVEERRLSDEDGLRTALRLNAVAILHDTAGDFREARRLHEQALAIREREFGTDHPALAASLINLAIVVADGGEREKAEALNLRAITLLESTLGSDHPQLGSALVNLALLRSEGGAPERARPMYERALGIFETAFGESHPNVAVALRGLAHCHMAASEYDSARELFSRALAIREELLPPDHANIASSLHDLGQVQLETGEHERARELLERALSIRETRDVPAHLRAETEFALARTLWDAALDRKRAISIARSARARLEGAGENHRDAAQEVGEWLEQRGP